MRVFEEDAYADRALRTAVRDLDERDRALARRLAYGAVQRVRTLDHAIETLGRRPVAKLDPPVRAALRLGAYQLGFVEGVPRYAAVNESVELVRSARLERAVPFTNAVLRRVADGIADLLAALPEETRGGGGAAPLLPGLGRRDMVARPRPGRRARVHAGAERAAPRRPSGSCAARSTGSRTRRSRARGSSSASTSRRSPTAACWPQSRGSQLAGLAVAAGEGDRNLDLCAAPGGKTTMLAGDVVAVEVNEARARELEENVRRLGAERVRVVHADGRDLPAELTGFDRALVDAPCSGLGVLAARPDLRWRARPLPELQRELLLAAAERVRPGGTIVYSVCTINRDEGERVVDASGLAVDASLGEEWPQFRDERRPEFLQTLPHLHGTSGFFIARLRT